MEIAVFVRGVWESRCADTPLCHSNMCPTVKADETPVYYLWIVLLVLVSQLSSGTDIVSDFWLRGRHHKYVHV